MLEELIQSESSKAFWNLSALSLSVSRTQPGVGERRPEPLNRSKSDEIAAEISPNGHWLAFVSNESGRNEVYVRPLPNVDGGRWQVSTGGATEPTWSRSGRELFFLDATGLLTVVPVEAGAAFHAGDPASVLHTRYSTGNFALLRNYDVSADGQRLLMIKDPPATIAVVRNWCSELNRNAAQPGGLEER